MATEVARPTGRSHWRLVVRECRWEVRLLARNPLAGLLLVVLPVLLLPLVHALNPHVRVTLPGTPRLGGGTIGFFGTGAAGGAGLMTSGAPTAAGPALYDQYLAPTLAAFGIAVASFANLAIGLTFAREDGSLKRLRGTPLPSWVHLAGRVASSLVLSLTIAAATIGAGVAFYGVVVPARLLPAAVVTVIVGAAVFCALGIAMTSALPSADVAPAAVFAVLLPMAFISNTFYPPQVEPAWMHTVARWLPLEPLSTALATAFNPSRPAPGFAIGELGALAGWGVVGVAATLFWFRWWPASERTRQRFPLVRRVAVPVIVVAVIVATTVIWLNRGPAPASAQSVDIGALDAIPDGGTSTRTIDLNTVRELSPTLQSSSLVAESSRLRLLVHRVDTTVTVVGAESTFTQCEVLDRAMVDTGWLGAIGEDPSSAVFVDPCSGSVFDTNGTCISTRCEPLLHVPAEIHRGDVVVRLDKAGLTFRGVNGVGGRPAAIPGEGAATYRTDGSDPTIKQDDLTITVPATITVIADDRGLRILGPPDHQPTLDLGLRTQGPLAGTIQSIALGPDQISTAFARRPLRWLSLPVGQQDQDSASGVITHADPTSWTIHTTARQGSLTMAMVTDRPLPPWRVISLDLSGTTPSGSELRIRLRLSRAA